MSVNVLGIQLWKVSADVFSLFIFSLKKTPKQTEWQNVPAAPWLSVGTWNCDWFCGLDFWSITQFNSERDTKPSGKVSRRASEVTMSHVWSHVVLYTNTHVVDQFHQLRWGTMCTSLYTWCKTVNALEWQVVLQRERISNIFHLSPIRIMAIWAKGFPSVKREYFSCHCCNLSWRSGSGALQHHLTISCYTNKLN